MKYSVICIIIWLLLPARVFSQNAKSDTDRFYLDFSDDNTPLPYKKPTIFVLKQKGTSVEIKKETFQKDFILSSEETSGGEIDFNKCKFSNARVISPDVNATFVACHFKNLQITPAVDDRDDYTGSVYIDTMENEGNLDIRDINLYKSMRISGKIKGTITISNVICKSSDINIDLTGLHPYIPGQKIRLNLTEAPFPNIKLDYEVFEVDTSVISHPNQAGTMYIGLLDNFKSHGLTKDYELLDIEYQH